MIAVADALQVLSLLGTDSQSPKTPTGDFGQLLSEVQGVTSLADGQTEEASRALESVLQTLADILQPLTFSVPAGTAVSGGTEATGQSLLGADASPASTAYRDSPASLAGGPVPDSPVFTGPATGVGFTPWTSSTAYRDSPASLAGDPVPESRVFTGPATGVGFTPWTSSAQKALASPLLLKASRGEAQVPLNTPALPEAFHPGGGLGLDSRLQALRLPGQGEDDAESGLGPADPSTPHEEADAEAAVPVQGPGAVLLSPLSTPPGVALPTPPPSTPRSTLAEAPNTVVTAPVRATSTSPQTDTRVTPFAAATLSDLATLETSPPVEDDTVFSALLQRQVVSPQQASRPVLTEPTPADQARQLPGEVHARVLRLQAGLDLTEPYVPVPASSSTATVSAEVTSTSPEAPVAFEARITPQPEPVAQGSIAPAQDSAPAAGPSPVYSVPTTPGDSARAATELAAFATSSGAEPRTTGDLAQSLDITPSPHPEAFLDEPQPSVSRHRPQDTPEPPAEPSLTILPGLHEPRLLSGLSAATTATTLSRQDPTAATASPGLDGINTPQPWRLPGASNTVLLHIEPPEFGPLLVHIRVHEKRLIASFQAESPDVEALLRANLPALQASLSQHGFEVQPISLSLAADGFSTALGNGAGSFSQQQSTFHAFTQAWQDADADQQRSEPEPARLFLEPRPYNRRLVDVVI